MDETRRHGISLLLGNATPACRLPEDLRELCNRCSFGFDKFYVDVHGNLMTCGMSRLVLGNLLSAPIREILNVSPIQQQYLNNLHVPEKCQSCADLENCGGGCRAAALAEGGELHCEDMLQFYNANSRRES